MISIPSTWIKTKIVKLLELQDNGKPFQQGWSPQCESYPASVNRWGVLKTTAIQQGEFWEHENKALPEHLEPKPQLEIRAGDILMTCAGPRNRCGVVCFVRKVRSKLLMSGKMYRFRPQRNILDPKYLEAFITSQQAQNAIDVMKTGISDSGLNLTHSRFAELQIPLAPYLEQQRIVAKIEALFSELDKGIENFKTAREQLKVYRQALLKHAFSGKLTEQWRAENPDKLESAEILLERIQNERQQRYQQQLKEWEANGRQGSKPKAPRTLPPLTAEELAELSELPKGWGWFRLVDVSDISGGLTKNQKRDQLPLTRPYLRVANVYANRLDLAEIHNIGISESELERVSLEEGDLLIVEGNGSIDQIGRVALWSGQIPHCVHQNHLIKSRPLTVANPKFLLYFLMSELGRKFIVRAASSTSGLHTLSISKVEGLFVPQCKIDEQVAVVSELESELSKVDELDQTLTLALQQAEALRQSILKKAFSGQLVPQDPNDEPAQKLLERIKAERATQNKLNKNQKRKTLA